MRIVVAVLLILSLVVPAAGLLAGCSDGAAGGATSAATTVTLEVDGMTCEDCENAIKAAVEKLPGVRSCLASHVEKIARVELEPGAGVESEQLANTIRGLGYTVTVR